MIAWAVGVLVLTALAAAAQATDRFRAGATLRVLALATLVLTALAGGAAHHAQGRVLLVALALALVAEAALLLPRMGGFVVGLAATLATRAAYVIAFLVGGFAAWWAIPALVVVLLFASTAGRRVVEGGLREGGQALRNALLTYLTVSAAMVVCGFATAEVLAAVGVSLVAFADLILGLNRFVGARQRAALVVTVCAPLGQLLIVHGLLR